MIQRAQSVRAESVRKGRSRSPQTVSSRITGAQDLPHPPQDLPPGQWTQPLDRWVNPSQGVWNTPVQDKVQNIQPFQNARV